MKRGGKKELIGTLIGNIVKMTSWSRAVPSSVPALKALPAIFIL